MNALDERGGHPSASAVSRLMACPGSKRLCANAPSLASDPDAERGTRIHKALETQDERWVPDVDDKEIWRDCMEIECKLLSEMWPGPQPGPTPKVFREERIWLVNDSFDQYFSGKLDVFYLHQGEALIIDFKSLWGDHDKPSVNAQLRSCVVLLADRYRKSIQRIRTVIAQPNRQPMPPCDYTLGDIFEAGVWLHEILDAAEKPDAPLNPGDHCRWCPARTICPVVDKAVTSLAVKHRWEVATPDERAMRIPLLKLGIKLATEELRAYKEGLRADPNFVAGYTIAPGRIDKPVTDIVELYRRTVGAGLMTAEAFMACCSVTKGKLEEALAAGLAVTGGEMGAIYAGILGSKQADGSLAEKE